MLQEPADPESRPSPGGGQGSPPGRRAPRRDPRGEPLGAARTARRGGPTRARRAPRPRSRPHPPLTSLCRHAPKHNEKALINVHTLRTYKLQRKKINNTDTQKRNWTIPPPPQRTHTRGCHHGTHQGARSNRNSEPPAFRNVLGGKQVRRRPHNFHVRCQSPRCSRSKSCHLRPRVTENTLFKLQRP